MALSMEEQRILDEMERQLCAEDPRLASRFNSFGLPRTSGSIGSQRARTISGILAFILIAAVTIMMFVLSPYSGTRHQPGPAPNTTPTSVAKTGGSTT